MPLPLASLRARFDRFLEESASILRSSTADQPDEGGAVTWSTIATGVPCMVTPTASGTEATSGSGDLVHISGWSVWLPAMTDVAEHDRITVTYTESGAVRTFEVEGADVESHEVTREAVCTLVE
jgi:hypothetical protein